MNIRSGKPSEMTAADKAAFIDFVNAGGEVNPATLPDLVENAVALVLLFNDGALIGTAAIKEPHPGHRRGEFAKADIAACADDFFLELGWVVVHPDHRKRGHAGSLVREAIALVGATGVYATTKTHRMRMILEESGFEAMGLPYPSHLKPEVKLTLFGKR